MITICKTFTFDAAHHIPTMPEGHKCRGMHGHTYSVDVIFRGMVDPKIGFFLDYGDIALRWAAVHDLIDHKVLNEIPGLEIPTTEVLAPWIFFKLCTPLDGNWLHAVRVHESSTTWCEYQPSL